MLALAQISTSVANFRSQKLRKEFINIISQIRSFEDDNADASSDL